jgi:hypothetical protein
MAGRQHRHVAAVLLHQSDLAIAVPAAFAQPDPLQVNGNAAFNCEIHGRQCRDEGAVLERTARDLNMFNSTYYQGYGAYLPSLASTQVRNEMYREFKLLVLYLPMAHHDSRVTERS